MTFRPAIVIIGLAAVLIVGGGTYWYSHRKVVLERPMLGPPPVAVRPHENLVGRAAPSFRAVDQNGQAVGTESLRGRVVVVNVWATWCPPCREELPRIEHDIWQRFGPRVAVVAVARGESLEKITEFNKRAGLTFSLVEDPNKRISRRFGGDDNIPRTYVIDSTGKVVHQTLGYGKKSFDELVAAVERALS